MEIIEKIKTNKLIESPTEIQLNFDAREMLEG